MNDPSSKFLAVAVAGAIAGGLIWYLLRAQPSPPKQVAPPAAPVVAPPKAQRSNQMLMRDKLAYASKALEGLSLEDYGKIAEAGDFMYMISKAASWHVIPTDEYVRLSKNFQEQSRDLKRHAEEKNLDAASLDYMRITHSCVQCHSYMRANRSPKR